MTNEEFMDAFCELRLLCTDVIGFHALAENASAEQPVPEAKRLEYEARVYAGGYTLALKVSRLIAELRSMRDDE